MRSPALLPPARPRPFSLRLALALLASAAACGPAGASSFFLFPIEQIEGLRPNAAAGSRPLIDAEMQAMLADDAPTREDLHARLRDTLRQQLQLAYPASVVNAAQVSTTRGGGAPAYLDQVSCGQGFRAPLGHSYAVVLGLSRASQYRIRRVDGTVEVLVPVTLNLQLLKPTAAKIAYSLSDTQYRSFRFSAAEWAAPASRKAVVDALKVSMQAQVVALVHGLKDAFQPRDAAAKVIGADQNAVVIDKGYESGLKEGEQIEVTQKASGRELLVKVLSTASGYSVVRPVDADLKQGDELQLSAGAALDDSRKPRVLPLIRQADGQGWTAAVAELVTKQIGFAAPFQVLPADVGFAATMDLTNASMLCLDEGAKKTLKKVAGERTEQPDFYLRFERSRSPVFHLAGAGGVETRDTFITALSAQLVDERGDVVFSALGSDTYRHDRVGDQGIAPAQAEEISLKNATEQLARQMVEKARLEPASFRIAKVEGDRLWVPGLSLPEGVAASFDVLRTLRVKVGARNAVRRLAIEPAGGAPAVDGGSTGLRFASAQDAEADDRPRAGDELRILNLPTPGQARYTECRSPYQPSNGSIAADYLLPLIRHASYGSALYKVNVGTPGFVGDANALLQENAFSPRLQPSEPTETCLRAAYLVREEPRRCESPALCSGEVRVAPAVLFIKGGTRPTIYSQNVAIKLDGFGESEAAAFVGLKAYEHMLKALPNLTSSLDTKK